MSTPLWITEQEVVNILDMRGAIAALERGLRLEAAGDAHAMGKTHTSWDGSTLHAIGAAFPVQGFVGTKTWAHTKNGASPLLILFDAANGSLAAVIEAFALGQMRTGSMSAIATDRMASPDARTLAIVGTGKQAFAQVAAVASVRSLERVFVYSPTQAHRAAFAHKLRQAFAFTVEEALSVSQAVCGADIVTLATRAREPFLHAADLAHGAHLNAVGAITLDRIEFYDDVFARATQIAVDAKGAVAQLSREFIDHFGAPEQPAWEAVCPISQLVAAQPTRAANSDVTLFKAMGTGLADLALGIDILGAARERGLGRALDAPVRAPIRFAEHPVITR